MSPLCKTHRSSSSEPKLCLDPTTRHFKGQKRCFKKKKKMCVFMCCCAFVYVCLSGRCDWCLRRCCCIVRLHAPVTPHCPESFKHTHSHTQHIYTHTASETPASTAWRLTIRHQAMRQNSWLFSSGLVHLISAGMFFFCSSVSPAGLSLQPFYPSLHVLFYLLFHLGSLGSGAYSS